MKSVLSLILIFQFLNLASCAHKGAVLEDMRFPLVQIKSKVIDILPLGLRKKSSNGREYFSEYYVEINGKYFNAKNQTERKFTKILILGDRRPYDVVITVYLEKKVGLSKEGIEIFRKELVDVEASKNLAHKLRSNLNNRREEMNVIDDFKVF